ncbi:ABC transporter ATP-binding protein [Chromohalobacter nigrandesensis]|uniref:ABC transporter ATP-binding protein n=1 Tax=Chromohalobacter nigrandesensis TaxID=119863 RepID=UPI001FF63474|nr:ABC transporter ATP-binding protein [Chromohalobacter nigrandesensis]
MNNSITSDPLALPRLEVSGLKKAFGGLVVAQNIDLVLKAGARTALIGPNGAGKSTFVNLVTGVLQPSSGSIKLDGEEISNLPQSARVRRGLVRSFQVTRLFKDLTVADNLRLAILQLRRQSFTFLRRIEHVEGLDAEVERILDILGLGDRASSEVRGLAYGEQRLVEIALVLALKPRVLLLDEPAAGVPQSESGIILQAVEDLPADLAVLLIEHDMNLVFRFATQIAVLVSGELLVEGTPEEISNNKEVRDIYLGAGV